MSTPLRTVQKNRYSRGQRLVIQLALFIVLALLLLADQAL